MLNCDLCPVLGLITCSDSCDMMSESYSFLYYSLKTVDCLLVFFNVSKRVCTSAFSCASFALSPCPVSTVLQLFSSPSFLSITLKTASLKQCQLSSTDDLVVSSEVNLLHKSDMLLFTSNQLAFLLLQTVLLILIDYVGLSVVQMAKISWSLMPIGGNLQIFSIRIGRDVIIKP